MKFATKNLHLRAGGGLVVVMHKQDAECIGAHAMDRVQLSSGSKKTIAILDIAEGPSTVKPGMIGLFEEVAQELKPKESVGVELAAKPKSVAFIMKKLEGQSLSFHEFKEIIKDIVDNRLSMIELTTFVLANYTAGLSEREVLELTKAMIQTGHRLRLPGKVADFHSIGGVPGNRTTPIVVPIVAATGVWFPKTSSRAITSPAGTADTMEVVCKVDLSFEQLQKVVHKTKGCLVWGGAVQLAPADDRIIRIENPLNIDAEGQMLASIMAKKASVGATHLLLEIPVGKGAKASRHEATHLQQHFGTLAKHLGIQLKVVVTDGSQPIGNGIGCRLEMRDILRVLRNQPQAPKDLRDKSLFMAGNLLEMLGKAKKGDGYCVAEEILTSGKALKKFDQMVCAQGGKLPRTIYLCDNKKTITASRGGVVRSIDNQVIARVAKIAGAPLDACSGVDLHVHRGDKIKKGQSLLTIYAMSKDKMRYALAAYKNGVEVR
ncbi:thymidine phosphorylase [Candidatus Woesearchaeota archaeon]|nr:thymidine phosphorylase [Candidatus Woesearchaeota archaeon]